MSAYVVGLTGGIGSGKTTVARLFEQRGVTVVDTDRIARQLTLPAGAAMPEIVAQFGTEVVAADGGLDRDAMRRRVFGEPALRHRLEAILHPRIRTQARRECASAASAYVLLDVPLLVETGGWEACCDRILVVDCDEETQVRRVMARNGLPENEVRAILAAQASRGQRLAIADDRISNDDTLEHLAEQVETLHQSYLRGAGAKILPVKC